MIGFDPLYVLLTLPAVLLASWAQYRVTAAYARARQIPTRVGLSGAEVARLILDRAGVRGVAIEMVAGSLSDHYDPSAKVLRLSSDVARGYSVASLGIAAHEAGHALQDATRYPLMGIRNTVVPVASLGSQAAFGIFFLGLVLSSTMLITAGLLLFGSTVVFQLVNLPVEFDASARAKRLLVSHGFVSGPEVEEVNAVLNAAALTYVAATLSSILTFLYFVIRSGLLSERRDEH